MENIRIACHIYDELADKTLNCKNLIIGKTVLTQNKWI